MVQMNLDQMNAGIFLSGMPKEYIANASAERAIYDALAHDEDFARLCHGLYSKGAYERLSEVLKGVLEAEFRKEFSDFIMERRTPESTIGIGQRLLATAHLGSAIGMLDEGNLDIIKCFKNAEGTLEIMRGLYEELKKGPPYLRKQKE